MVDQPQMVVQVAANQVTMYEFQRWASPLKSEIARVIAANLAQELGTARVWAYAQTTLANPDYQVLVDVQRFDSVLGEAVTIDALWSIRRAAGGAPKTGRSSVREAVSGAGFDALVAAHSRALARREPGHRRRDPRAVAAPRGRRLGRRPRSFRSQYSTTGLPGEPVAPIIFSGAQMNAPS